MDGYIISGECLYGTLSSCGSMNGSLSSDASVSGALSEVSEIQGDLSVDVRSPFSRTANTYGDTVTIG